MALLLGKMLGRRIHSGKIRDCCVALSCPGRARGHGLKPLLLNLEQRELLQLLRCCYDAAVVVVVVMMMVIEQASWG
jgi:hypothetical protein